jgi:hypothetical protein
MPSRCRDDAIESPGQCRCWTGVACGCVCGIPSGCDADELRDVPGGPFVVIRYPCPTEAEARVTQPSYGEFYLRPHPSEMKPGDRNSGSRGVHCRPPMTAGETAGSAAPDAWRLANHLLTAQEPAWQVLVINLLRPK